MVKSQLGITSTAVDCSPQPLVDANTPIVHPPDDKGCCDAGALGSSSMLSALGVAWVLMRRRRQRRA